MKPCPENRSVTLAYGVKGTLWASGAISTRSTRSTRGTRGTRSTRRDADVFKVTEYSNIN